MLMKGYVIVTSHKTNSLTVISWISLLSTGSLMLVDQIFSNPGPLTERN